MSLNLDKTIIEHLKIFHWSREVLTVEDRAYILPTLLNEFVGEQSVVSALRGNQKDEDAGSSLPPIREGKIKTDSKPNKLWEFNEECPECGAPANHTIRACETGLSYCSYKCAHTHVNKKEGDE